MMSDHQIAPAPTLHPLPLAGHPTDRRLAALSTIFNDVAQSEPEAVLGVLDYWLAPLTEETPERVDC